MYQSDNLDLFFDSRSICQQRSSGILIYLSLFRVHFCCHGRVHFPTIRAIEIIRMFRLL